MNPIDVEFVMQVWTCCQPCTANRTYYVSLGNTPAFANILGEARQVGIQSLVAIGVPHNNDVSIAPFAANEIYMTVGGGPYACPKGCAVVDPLMCAPCLEYRMEAR